MNTRRKKLFRKKIKNGIYILPNLFTTGNLFFGFFSIIKSIEGDYVLACYAIVAAAIFDLLDGRVARMTRSTSEFGAEYDSMSDLISFGLAPGLLLYFWSLKPFGRLGWLASFFYLACGALRLVRFNVNNKDEDKAFFQGLPIPMAAGIVASCVLAFNDLGWSGMKSPFILSMTFLLGFVMVSNFRYRSFKDLDLKERLPFRYLVVGVFTIALVAIRPEIMLAVAFLIYTILGAIFGVLRIGRKPRKGDDSLDPDEDFVDDIEVHFTD